MNMKKAVRKIMKSPLYMMLRWGAVRKRMIYELKRRYYSEFGVNMPIGRERMCPICYPDAVYSFSEIFVKKEYEKVFDLIPVPDRWIDLGCLFGYFSLYLAQLRDKEKRETDLSAFLLDGDSRAEEAVKKLFEIGNIGGAFIFRHGIIAAGEGEKTFVERPYMTSSLESLDPEGGKRAKVRVLTEADIIKAFPPPYDLIKADIEGAERYLLENYESILEEARYLVLEWHPSAGEEKDIVMLAGKRGFRLITRWDASVNGKSGLLVFENTLRAGKTCKG